jgi:hypothetical protein
VFRCIPGDAVESLMTGGADFTPFHWRQGLKQWLAGFASVKDMARFALSGVIPAALAHEWEVTKLLWSPHFAAGRPEAERRRIAERWISALVEGGYSEVEAVALILDRDIPGWCKAPAIIHKDELPPERYRDAWRRSSNGGPVWIDDEKKITIEEARAWASYEPRMKEARP